MSVRMPVRMAVCMPVCMPVTWARMCCCGPAGEGAHKLGDLRRVLVAHGCQLRLMCLACSLQLACPKRRPLGLRRSQPPFALGACRLGARGGGGGVELRRRRGTLRPLSCCLRLLSRCFRLQQLVTQFVEHSGGHGGARSQLLTPLLSHPLEDPLCHVSALPLGAQQPLELIPRALDAVAGRADGLSVVSAARFTSSARLHR